MCGGAGSTGHTIISPTLEEIVRQSVTMEWNTGLCSIPQKVWDDSGEGPLVLHLCQVDVYPGDGRASYQRHLNQFHGFVADAVARPFSISMIRIAQRTRAASSSVGGRFKKPMKEMISFTRQWILLYPRATPWSFR
jgi:hypothetical protein